MVTRGPVRGGGGIAWESGIDMYTLLYLERITNKDCRAEGNLLSIT